ncbi:MAG: CRISPR-associated endonuclease Cas1 [Pseudomonadota bacterium]|nr:CRISPR-associated endonuclease Cas1 [Pseudomonadota bacterium]
MMDKLKEWWATLCFCPPYLASLAEVGLQLNMEKTAVRSFAQGFRYLGYLFMNSLVLDVGGEQLPTTVVTPEPKTPQPNLKKAVIRIGEMDVNGTVVFVTGGPTTVTTLNEQLRVTRVGQQEQELLLTLPWHQVQALVLLGNQHISTPALRAALYYEVPVHFANSGGHYQGCTGAWMNTENQLWLAQISWFSHPENSLQAAQSLVVARLRHQREVLRQRNVKHRFDEVLTQLERLANRSRRALDLASLRGLEGQGAQCYFETLQKLLPTWVGFSGRERRPPPDPFNALLSLGYTVLAAHVDTVIRACGLLPWVGMYHQPHGRHAVLVSDLMEPFRHLVEREALKVLTHKKLSAEDFLITDTQGCRLRDEARRQYLRILSERFETPFRGQHLESAEKLHRHLYWQVQILRMWLQGQVELFSAWRMH